ncbi:4326_t:CDS:10 [Diversispora eburnea]|uniref:4326_t:CDS:1 n=1 Tax=Diversispora eburnea TaxID=1213867 RepID=A0A9N9AFY9_9GLOM|nr:4326_t:CDS:10 [Diversispora eburnea]
MSRSNKALRTKRCHVNMSSKAQDMMENMTEETVEQHLASTKKKMKRSLETLDREPPQTLVFFHCEFRYNLISNKRKNYTEDTLSVGGFDTMVFSEDIKNIPENNKANYKEKDELAEDEFKKSLAEADIINIKREITTTISNIRSTTTIEDFDTKQVDFIKRILEIKLKPDMSNYTFLRGMKNDVPSSKWCHEMVYCDSSASARKADVSKNVMIAVFVNEILLRSSMAMNDINDSISTTPQQPTRARRTTPNNSRNRPRAVTPEMVCFFVVKLKMLFSALITLFIIGGDIPSTSQASSSTSTSSTSTDADSQRSLIDKYKLQEAVNRGFVPADPPKKWEATPEKRQELLQLKKDAMVLMARERYLKQQRQKEQKEASVSNENETTSTVSTSSLAGNNYSQINPVDEGELRRRQILEATERRWSKEVNK